MAIWVCESCGFTKETRCKPKKCECSGVTFVKKEEKDHQNKQEENK